MVLNFGYRGEHATDHPEPLTVIAPYTSMVTHTSLPETSSLSGHTLIDHTTAQASSNTRTIHYSTIDITTTITLTPTLSEYPQAQQTQTRVDDQYNGSQPDYLTQGGAGSSDNAANEMIRLTKRFKRSETNSGSLKQYRTQTFEQNTEMLDGSDSHHNDLSVNRHRDSETGLTDQERSEPNMLGRRAAMVSSEIFYVSVAYLLTASCLLQRNFQSTLADRDPS